MLTAGVDLSSLPARTASCSVEWTNGRAIVTNLVDKGVEDPDITDLIAKMDKVGFDVPLGWPDPFVRAVIAHHEQLAWPGGSTAELRYRKTDLHVANAFDPPRLPLSVSSDRIAVPAFRAARIFSGLPEAVDRSGVGKVVEVYPVAALRRWGFEPMGYKRKAGAENRKHLVAKFRTRTESWLSLTDDRWMLCEQSDDAFDALIAALVARAAALGLIDPCPDDLRDVASREGWIALPAPDSLDRLG